MLLTFSDYATQAKRLADALHAGCEIIDVHYFPDGECKLRLPPPLPPHVVFCRALDQPHHKLIELMLSARTARELGARELTLVAPYLCYMRQDVAFTPGEAVSQRIIGRFLADHFDNVITVDPHLHRVHTLAEAVPARTAITVRAAPLIGEFLRTQLADALVLGPDVESAQWVETVAQRAGWDFAVARKDRRGDRSVCVALPTANYENRNVVIVDDMASTGHTLAETAVALRERGARAVHVAVTHGLFVAGAVELLKRAQIENIWTTDSVSSAGNGIPLAPLLADAVRRNIAIS
jgi:ribose-phosphate pyrophosphokinase